MCGWRADEDHQRASERETCQPARQKPCAVSRSPHRPPPHQKASRSPIILAELAQPAYSRDMSERSAREGLARALKASGRFSGRDQAIAPHGNGSRFGRTSGGNRVLLAQAGHSPSRPGFAGRRAHLFCIEQLGNLMVRQTTGELSQCIASKKSTWETD